MLLCNNCLITSRNNSLFLHRWFERSIYFVIDMFYESGNILSYEDFMHVYNFPIPFKEFQQVVKAIPNGLIQLINNRLSFGSNERIFQELNVDRIEIFSSSCNNKHIRHILQSKHKTSPGGKLFWNAKISDITWKTTWSNPYKFCILNKVKEVHFKILHKMYPCKVALSKFMDIDSTCSFCNTHEEDLCHLFYNCDLSLRFCSDVSAFLFLQRNVNYMLSLKYVICTYTHKSKMVECVVNFYILQAKYYIHKQKFAKCTPKCNLLFSEMDALKNSLMQINKKNYYILLDVMDNFFSDIAPPLQSLNMS